MKATCGFSDSSDYLSIGGVTWTGIAGGVISIGVDI